MDRMATNDDAAARGESSPTGEKGKKTRIEQKDEGKVSTSPSSEARKKVCWVDGTFRMRPFSPCSVRFSFAQTSTQGAQQALLSIGATIESENERQTYCARGDVEDRRRQRRRQAGGGGDSAAKNLWRRRRSRRGDCGTARHCVGFERHRVLLRLWESRERRRKRRERGEESRKS